MLLLKSLFFQDVKKLHEGMDDWPKELVEGMKDGEFLGMYIRSFNGKYWARTAKFKVNEKTTKKLLELLDGSGNLDKPIKVSEETYTKFELYDNVLQGYSVDGDYILYVTRTVSEYIVVGKVSQDDDNGKCRQAVIKYQTQLDSDDGYVKWR